MHKDIWEVDDSLKNAKKNILELISKTKRRPEKKIKEEFIFMPRQNNKRKNSPFQSPHLRREHSLGHNQTKAIVKLPKLPFGQHKSYNDIHGHIKDTHVISIDSWDTGRDDFKSLTKKFNIAAKEIQKAASIAQSIKT